MTVDYDPLTESYSVRLNVHLPQRLLANHPALLADLLNARSPNTQGMTLGGRLRLIALLMDEISLQPSRNQVLAPVPDDHTPYPGHDTIRRELDL
jgi:hypothetical protein